jgi:antitoxin ParD1/3/4
MPAVSMTSMNVSLPEELKEYAEEQTKNGYSTPSEYVRELIREDQKRRAKEKLNALLLEGLNSGEPLPVDAKFWSDLRQEALAKLNARKKPPKKK